MKGQPDLNKVKFTKIQRKRRLKNMGKGKKGRESELYNWKVIVKKSVIIKVKQMEAIRKYITKKLKSKENKNQKNLKILKSLAKRKEKVMRKPKKKEKFLLLRRNFCLGLTKKPLQVRMGKGKGSPVDWVYPCSRERVVIEFSEKKMRWVKAKKLLKKAAKKLSPKGKVKLKKQKNKKIKEGEVIFERLRKEVKGKKKKIRCIQEL